MSFLLGPESTYRGQFLDCIPHHLSITMVYRALNASVENSQGQFRILSWKCDKWVCESVATPFADVLARVGDKERSSYMTFDILVTEPELNPFLSHLAGVINFYFLFHVLRSTWHSRMDLSALLAKDGAVSLVIGYQAKGNRRAYKTSEGELAFALSILCCGIGIPSPAIV